MPECPECNSTNLYKKGTRAGKQRYQCKDCGRYFVEGTKFVGRQIKLPSVVQTCPQCGSTHIRRDGLLETGGQRYKCGKCGKGFSTKTVYREPVKYPCPYCGGKLRRSGHGKLGQPEYLCTVCGKSCSGDPPKAKAKAFKEVNTEVNCPYCNSRDIILRGTQRGFRRYLCNDCKRAFTDLTQSRLEKEKEKPRYNEVCPRCGGTHIISAGISRGKQRFRCMTCKRTYTKGFEQLEIPDSEKRKILMYKFNLRLPVADIARAFKCTEYAVRKIIKESGLVK